MKVCKTYETLDFKKKICPLCDENKYFKEPFRIFPAEDNWCEHEVDIEELQKLIKVYSNYNSIKILDIERYNSFEKFDRFSLTKKEIKLFKKMRKFNFELAEELF